MIGSGPSQLRPPRPRSRAQARGVIAGVSALLSACAPLCFCASQCLRARWTHPLALPTVRGGRAAARLVGRAVPGVREYVTFPPGPNPMVVDVFLREKGVDPAPMEKFVDLVGNDNRGEACLRMNPQGSLPWFVLEDDTVIAETTAMCEYVEEQVPEPPLIGATAAQRGVVRMWQRRLEEHYIHPAFYGHRFWTSSDDCASDHFMRDFFAERLGGPKYGAKIIPHAWKELLEWGRNRIIWLEQVKQDDAKRDGKASDFIAGDTFTVVDIQVYIVLWFFGEEFPHPPQPILEDLRGQLPWVQAWYDRVGARPSMIAAKEHRNKADEEHSS